jgi:hypothetical protein
MYLLKKERNITVPSMNLSPANAGFVHLLVALKKSVSNLVQRRQLKR